MTGPHLPTGTVTFLFTDIEGSTRLLQRLGDEYADILTEHHDLLLDAIERSGGVRVGTDGDSVFGVFPTATGALAAAVDGQRRLAAHPWPTGVRVDVRMGMHTGQGALSGGRYVGIDVHRAARISAAAHGGQIVVSGATAALVSRSLPDDTSLRDLGEHRLKDLDQPEELWQVDARGLRSDFPPPRSLDARPNNLPRLPTSFIGRSSELAEVKRLLGDARLLTLTGPGGTGKTRLALEATGETMTDHADGAFFVPLASITDPALVPSSIALALGIKEAGEAQLGDMVRDFLRSRDILLLLDNFEQILDAAPMVGALLAEAPRLRVLVTSREALHLSGEQEYAVPPLRLPEPDRLPPVDTLSQFDSVALFVQRARAVDSTFEITNDNAPAVAEICVRLDGLPLAIELAAARTKLFPPGELLKRLEHRLTVLRGGARDLPARQQTLRDAIGWSFDLLDPDERTLFARLGVFRGGCTFDAGEAVVGDVGLDVLDGIESLIGKSLLRRAEEGAGGPRVWMLETIREYAIERLDESGDGPAIRAQHTDFFLRLAEEAEPKLTSDDQVDWLDRIEREHDNVRSTLRRCIDEHDAEPALRTSGAIWRFWHLRGHLSEGRTWLTEIVAMPEAAAATAARAKALVALGGLTYWQTDYPAASAAYDEALAIYRSVGDAAGTMETLYSLAYIRGIEGRFEDGAALARESREIAEASGSVLGLAYAQHILGALRYYQGDLQDALGLSLDASRRFRELGERFGTANAMQVQSAIHRDSRRFREAREAAMEGLSMFMEAKAESGMAFSLGSFGALMIAEGNVEDGVRVSGAADAMEESVGGRAPVALRGYGDARSLARPVLGEEATQRAWDEGRALSFDEAMALVRAGDPA